MTDSFDLVVYMSEFLTFLFIMCIGYAKKKKGLNYVRNKW